MRPEDVKIVFPLDVKTLDEAHDLLKQVAPYVDVLKIGHEFLNNVGNHQAIKFAKSYEKEIFVDCKLTDIPNSVVGGALGIAKQSVDYLNVMATSGFRAMKETVEAVNKAAIKFEIRRPKIIAVTILTSLGFSDLIRQGYRPDYDLFVEFIMNNTTPKTEARHYAALNRLCWADYQNRIDHLFKDKAEIFEKKFVSSVVMNLAEMAVDAGCDILLSSPQESAKMHERWPDIPLYSPGIRLPDSPADDQQRTLTPGEAVKNGVQYLVIGRPIRNPESGRTRKETIELIRADIAQALAA